MDISVVIVNYNSWKVLEDCIKSIDSLHTSLQVELLIVDNESPNDLFTTFQQKYPFIHWIKNTGNNGFANGCNLGAQHATSDYLFFLNPDTRLKDGVLEHFLDIYSKENIGILSCKQTNTNNSLHKYNLLFPTPIRVFGILRSLERAFSKKRLEEYFKETKTRSYPDWISGSALFLSKKKFNEISKWNEDYWMYFEDVDICKKASLINMNCVITKEVSLFHLHGGASRTNPKTKAITKSEVIKSRHVYISNYFSKTSQSILHPILITNNMIGIGLMALLSYPLFFINSLKVNRYKWKELLMYYLHVYTNKTWLSERSMNCK